VWNGTPSAQYPYTALRACGLGLSGRYFDPALGTLIAKSLGVDRTVARDLSAWTTATPDAKPGSDEEQRVHQEAANQVAGLGGDVTSEKLGETLTIIGARQSARKPE